MTSRKARRGIWNLSCALPTSSSTHPPTDKELCCSVTTALACTSAEPLSLKWGGVCTLVITSGCTDWPTAHTAHIGSGAELLLPSLIHDQRHVRIVQQHNELVCHRQRQDLLRPGDPFLSFDCGAMASCAVSSVLSRCGWKSC